MHSEYSFLKDELALQEIRKHKWIESEKLGQEIGFATAAVDWVSKYGADFAQYRSRLKTTNTAFYELRKYRRYNTNIPVQLTIGRHLYQSIAKDVSLIGFSTVISDYHSINTSVAVSMDITIKNTSKRMIKFRFNSQVLRVNEPFEETSNSNFNIFIPFTENFREFMRTNMPFDKVL